MKYLEYYQINQMEKEQITKEVDVFGQWKGDITFIKGNKNDLIKQIDELTGCRYKSGEWRFGLEVTIYHKVDIYNIHYKESILLEDVIEEMSKQDVINIIRSTSTKGHPLHWTCRNNNIGALRRWIASGVSVDLEDQLGWTPLMYACFWGKINIVEELIKYGADVGHISTNGGTPLMLACMEGYDIIAKTLIASGDAKKEHHDKRKRNALDYMHTYIIDKM